MDCVCLTATPNARRFPNESGREQGTKSYRHRTDKDVTMREVFDGSFYRVLMLISALRAVDASNNDVTVCFYM